MRSPTPSTSPTTRCARTSRRSCARSPSPTAPRRSAWRCRTASFPRMVDTAVAIRDEQVRQLYRQSRTVFLPNLVAMPAIVYALWDAFPHSVLLGWGAALYFVTAVRALAVWLGGRSGRKGPERLSRGWLLAVLNLVSGSVWGVGAFLVVGQADPLAQAFFIIMLAAMVAGAGAFFSPFYPGHAAFALPGVGPGVLRAKLGAGQNPGGDAAIHLLPGHAAGGFP